MLIIDSIKLVQKCANILNQYIEKYEKLYNECDYEKLVTLAERNLKTVSDLHLAQRNLVNTLYEAFPSLPHHADDIEFNALHISVESLDKFHFPVYRITLPYLLPNKRERKTTFKNAITAAAISAIKMFCKRNRVVPFEQATIIFVSSYESETLNIDNDNKESVVIINGLIGRFIRDDRASVCNSIYYSRRIDHGAKTEIFIMDAANDIDVYSAIKAGSIES